MADPRSIVEAEVSEEAYTSFKLVLKYTDYEHLLTISTTEPQEAEPSVERSDSTPSEEEGQAIHWYTTLIDPRVDTDDEFLAEIKIMEDEVLDWLVSKFK